MKYYLNVTSLQLFNFHRINPIFVDILSQLPLYPLVSDGFILYYAFLNESTVFVIFYIINSSFWFFKVIKLPSIQYIKHSYSSSIGSKNKHIFCQFQGKLICFSSEII